MANLRWLLLALALGPGSAAAEAPKPDKIPVALGSWKGTNASAFKGALARGLSKECKVVGAKAARVVVEGTVSPQDKKTIVRLVVKLAKSGEVVEQRDFTFAKPKPSQGQANKMGHAVAEIARRAPAE